MENKALKERNSSLKISHKEMEEKVMNLKDELAATSDLQYSSVSVKLFSQLDSYVSFLQNKSKIKIFESLKIVLRTNWRRTLKSETIFGNRMLFKNDEIVFYFILKSSFRSQDTHFFYKKRFFFTSA